MAAEYEVNIKINTQKVVTDLGTVDKTIKNLGKSAVSQEKSLERIVDKRARLMNRINEMEAKGLKVDKLRKQMGKATEQQSRRDLANAQKEYRILERSIRLEQSKLKILRSQREGFPASPIRGIRSMMGSPAQIAAAGRQIASPIGGSTTIPGSPKAIQAAKATELRATQVQGSWSKALGQLQETAKIFQSKNARVRQSWTTALGQLSEIAKNISTNRTARVRESWTTALSQLEETAKDISRNSRKRRRQRLEQVGLGAGFPLLFGGGAGSVIGGGLGGLTGSFGAQIALSALGQQIDKFVAGMVDAGKALTSVGGAADFMAEKSLFSSDSMQFRIEKLIEEGQVTEAAALMTQEMAKQVGGSGLKALKDLGTEASKMGKIFGTLLLRVQAFIAQGLTPLIKIINRAIGGLTAQSQLDQMIAEAGSPERGAEILARSRELRGVRRSARTGKAAGLNALTPEIIQKLQEEYPALIPEGAAIAPTQLEILRAADSGADKAAKDKERIDSIIRKTQEKLQVMQQEGDLAKKLKELDFDRAAAIREINELEHASTKQREDAIKATNELFDAQKGEAIGEALAKDLQTAIELKKAQDDILRPLEDQKKLLEAKLVGNEKEVRLQLQIRDIMESVEGLNKEDVENAVRKIALLEEQAKAAEKLDQVYASIGQSISSGIVDALTAAVEGTKSLADVASQTLRQVANILVQFGVQTALGGIPGFNRFFPGKALGGPVGAGQPYLVGERGPELFVPGAQGNIVPSNAMGGANVVVNVDASGTQTQGSEPNAKALGAAIGAAVQAELIKQKRPGGLLS